MYSAITASVSPSFEHLETSRIHQATLSLFVLLADARTREAMRVFGASVHSEPIVPNLCLPQGLKYQQTRGHQGERVVLEAGFNDLKVFSWGQLMQFVEQLTDLG
jgi:hypothetical protein